ncbi:MAG TPA: glycosyltransferase family 1 protein [Mucilaginibacter sp.]
MKNFVLISNYLPDRQESMQRFSNMLYSGLRKNGHSTEIWRPPVFFGKYAKSTISGIGKWLGYIDKYILFPIILKSRVNKALSKSEDVIFHICDHSLAPYLKYLPKDKTGITCHDVLAIRGSMGYTDSASPASFFGKYLQKWILANLKKAPVVACVSRFTLNQLNELSPLQENEKKTRKVIYNGFNAEFKPLSVSESEQILSKINIGPNVPFLLHVGSDLPRKNRKLLIDLLVELGDSWNGQVCFAGKAIDKSLMAYAVSKGMKERIIEVLKPDHLTLLALYSSCYAFVFPSISEGFGWPVIEAQACGAPVIASSHEPMPEVSGGAALYADPFDAPGFANALCSLENQATRDQIVQAGINNSLKYHPDRMITSYLNLYGLGNRIEVNTYAN